jgi:hypothetical protein
MNGYRLVVIDDSTIDLFLYFLSVHIFTFRDNLACLIAFDVSTVADSVLIGAFKAETVPVYFYTFAVFHSTLESAAIFLAVFLAEYSIGVVHFVVFPDAVLDIAVTICKLALAVAVVVSPAAYVA